MPVSAKELKLLRAKQQRDQNTRNQQESLIQELASTYNLIAPSLSDHEELTRWARLQHRRLSEIKNDREKNMQGNNSRIEHIIEEQRVEVKQALEQIAVEREVLMKEYQELIDKEKEVFEAEQLRIQDKHQYLLSSNRIALSESRRKLDKVSKELQMFNDQLKSVNEKLKSHKSRNDKRRKQSIEITRLRQQAKKDKRVLLERLRNACDNEEMALSDIQSRIDMYPEYRRRINEDYYNWLDDVKQTEDDIAVLESEIDKDVLDEIFIASGLDTNNYNEDATSSTAETDGSIATRSSRSTGTGASTSGSSAVVRQESLDMLKAELSRLQNEDYRRLPDDRYRKLDSEKGTWLKDSVARKRQISRLQAEMVQADSICPDAISLESINRLTPQELEHEAQLDYEYQNLKTQQQQLTSSITMMQEELDNLSAQVATARRILGEERYGLGEQLQEQWNRCQLRLSKITERADKKLDEQLNTISLRVKRIKDKDATLQAEKNDLEHQNRKLGDSDSRCHLNNNVILAALQCIEKLQKIL